MSTPSSCTLCPTHNYALNCYECDIVKVLTKTIWDINQYLTVAQDQETKIQFRNDFSFALTGICGDFTAMETTPIGNQTTLNSLGNIYTAYISERRMLIEYGWGMHSTVIHSLGNW